MKQTQHITFNGPRTTPTDVCRWAQEALLVCMHVLPRALLVQSRIGGCWRTCKAS